MIELNKFRMFKQVKIFLILFLIVLSVTQYAQESQKGKIKLSLSGIPVIDWNNGYYGFALKPGIEYFFTDNLSIHNDFFYHVQTGFYVDEVKSKSNTIGFISSIRYYLSFKNKKWLVFGQAGIGFGSVLYKHMDDDETTSDIDWLNSGVVIYSAGVGVGYRFSSLFEMEVLVPYIVVDNITNNYNADILFNGVGPTIGVKFSLN